MLESGNTTATAMVLPGLNVGSNTYNADNEMTSFLAADDPLTYDANGNLTSDGQNTYTWDARNHLSAISGAPVGSFAYVYDALDRRVSKSVAGTTTQFVYDGLNPVQELQSGSASANLLTGLNLDELFQRTDSAGARALLTDALGSTWGLADSSGTVQSEYSYQPFGSVTPSGATSTNPYLYTGREDDSGAGPFAGDLYYNRARYYSPELQRFMSQDPVGFAGGDPNLYGYTFNSPTNFRDPSGRGLIGAGIGLVVGGIEGYEAARLQGQCGLDAAIGAALGALGGGLVGLLDPTEGVLSIGEIAVIGGEAGAVGDIAGQLYSNGGDISDLGPFEVAGAGLGGAASTALGLWGAGAASSELGGAALGSLAGSGPGLFGAPIGAELDNLAFPPAGRGSSSSCGCLH